MSAHTFPAAGLPEPGARLPAGLADMSGLHVVVPAFCEAEVIADTVTGLLKIFPNVVVVDDNSSDATAEIASRAGATVLKHPVNLGQGASLQTGISFALDRGAAYIATFDADGQHRPADLQAMFGVLASEGVDIVLGSRFLEGAATVPRGRAVVLKAAVLFSRATTRLVVTDSHNGLRVMTAAAARHIQIRQNRMAHASEIMETIARGRLSFREVPVTIRYSEYSLRKGQKLTGSLSILVDLLIGWLRR